MNDPMTILKQDHREVRGLLEKLSDSEPGRQRTAMLDQVAQSLSLHMEIEEEILYPVVQRIEGDEPAEEANIEHGLAREGLDKALAMVDQPGFGAVAQMLLGGIEHHIEEEEKEILPALKRELPRNEWLAIGDAIVAAKAAAGAPRSTKAPARKQPAKKAATRRPAKKTAKRPAKAASTRRR